MQLQKIVLLVFALLGMAQPLSAQFSISRVTPKEIDTKAIFDTIKQESSLNNQFFSMSRHQAERRRIRKERNTIDFRTSVTLSQTGFSNWAAGGDNTFVGNAALFFSHQYQREKFGLHYDFDARYGVNVIDDAIFKNEDAFVFNAGGTWQINKNFSYATSFQFRSQFSKGYVSRTDHTVKSDFMAPGTMTLGLGITYKNLKTPLTINISPVGGSLTFVTNEDVFAKTNPVPMYGVKPGETQVGSIGSSIQIDFEHPFAKERLLYKTYFYTFTNYGTNTYINWKNELTVKIFKIIAFKPFCSLVYDKYTETPTGRPLQVSYVLGLGLAYTFKNK